MATEFIGKNKNIIINMLLIAVAAFIAYNYIYKKQYDQLQNLKAQRDMEIKRNQVLDSIGQQEANIYAYKKMLPQKDPTDLINSITNIAKDFGITITSISPSVEIKAQDYSKLPFDLAFTAPNYNSLGKFMTKLETYSDFYVVDIVNISPQDQKGQLKATLIINSIAMTE